MVDFNVPWFDAYVRCMLFHVSNEKRIGDVRKERRDERCLNVIPRMQ